VLNLLIFIHLFSLPSNPGGPEEPVIIEGSTMGTTYRIIYFDSLHRNFKPEVDSLLALVNKSINTYDSTSEISRFNKSEKGICFQLPHLYEILRKAKKINKASDGAFDPSVMPLVNAWGFGPGKAIHPDKEKIDSLKRLTGFDKVRVSKKRITKAHPRLQLDMGGIGQGYGVDVVFDFLQLQGIRNMLVELGGEGVALGKNLQKMRPWTIGILDPNSTPHDQFFKAYVTLHDLAFTTSGNYFNYRIEDGRKFGHTIDPVSGYPLQHSLLSASVFAAECATADGWATAFMVMGFEKALEKLKSLKGIDVLFVYSNDAGEQAVYISPRLKKNVILE
jgi:thiamine biosynthesis lipoprotein